MQHTNREIEAFVNAGRQKSPFKSHFLELQIMNSVFDYQDFVARNSGYVSAETQDRIRRTRLLVAGCGIGSSLAVCAARIGFENFILIDGDTVEVHNLNRQFFDFADVGRLKVDALAEKILRINPQAKVQAVPVMLDDANTPQLVAKADIVFDTVDFLDLPAILGLHANARQRGIHVFTALSAGFGALVWYFAPGTGPSLADVLAPDVALAGARRGAKPSYVDVFESFMQRLAPHLDAEVVEQVTLVLSSMKDGIPCPASQVAVGSFAVGALAMSMIHDLLAGRPVPASPQLVVHSFRSHQAKIVEITGKV
jgi:molybdopterin/thiamine biosynthesis adenylyltransferase